MKELLKSVAYTGIGVAFLTKEIIEELKDDLVEQEKISQIVEEKIKQFDIVTNDDFADLCRQVEELQVALNKNPKT